MMNICFMYCLIIFKKNSRVEKVLFYKVCTFHLAACLKALIN